MSDNKTKLGLNLKSEEAKADEPKAEADVKEEKVAVPEEFASKNNGIRVVKEGDQITIMFLPNVSEEIGAYRRCNMTVRFQEGGDLEIIPKPI